MAETGARFLVVCGTTHYANAPELPSVSEDLRQIVELFTGEAFGYKQVLPELHQNATRDLLVNSLGEWLTDEARTESDVVVFYFSGHGVTQAGKHYLLLADADEERIVRTALPTETLLEMLGEPGVKLRHLLVMIDTCFAARGASDIAAVASRLVEWRPLDRAPELWIVAAAREREEADQGVFARAFAHAVRSSKAGARQSHIAIDEVVQTVNLEFQRLELHQQARFNGSGGSLAPFLPNRRYRPGLPPGFDVETQQQLIQEGFVSHWGPRSRGVEIEAQRGWHFTGRARVLKELVSWLTAVPNDGKIRIVTGGPGSGKSAVLARLVTLSDPEYRRRVPLDEAADDTIPPEGVVDFAVNARGKSLEQIVSLLGAAAGLETGSSALVVDALARRSRRFTLVLDSLDEAGEPRRLLSELLIPLTVAVEAGADLCLLVGTRRELLPSLRGRSRVLNLDDPSFVDILDLAGYAERLLLAEDRSPYHGHPELARPIAVAIARRAFPTFLIARIVASSLIAAGELVSANDYARLDRFPSTVGNAFEEYLERFDENEERVRDLLTPLAYAEGAGLPWADLWAPIASEISGRSYGDGDIRWLLAHAGSYIVESVEGERSVYRLYHQALVDHLRDPAHEEGTQRQFISILVARTPLRGAAGQKDWLAAYPYIRRHLATHAALVKEIDDLLIDPLFLLAADRTTLLRALPAASREDARAVAQLYRRAADRFDPTRPQGEIAAYLELIAHQAGAIDFAKQVAALPVSRSWRIPWAHWLPATPHTIVGRHQGSVTALVLAEVEGRLVLASGAADGIGIWDPVDGSGFRIQTGYPVSGLTVGQLGGRAVLFAASRGIELFDLESGESLGRPIDTGDDALAVAFRGGDRPLLASGHHGRILLWDAATGASLGVPLLDFWGSVTRLEFADLNGRTVLVGGGDMFGDPGLVKAWSLDDLSLLWDSGETRGVLIRSLTIGADENGRAVVLAGAADACVRAWDLETGELRWQYREEGQNNAWVNSLALGALDGTPLIAWTVDRGIQVFDLPYPLRPRKILEGHDGSVCALAMGMMSGRSVVFSGGEDGTVRAWDLVEGLQASRPSAGPASFPKAVAICKVRGQDVAVSIGADCELRLWSLAAGELLGAFPAENGVLATAELSGRPVAVVGEERSLQRWDLEGLRVFGDPLVNPKNGERLYAVAMTELDDRLVIVAGDSGCNIHLWDFASGAYLRSFSSPYYDDRVVLALAVASLGGRKILVSGGGDRRLTVWDLETPSPRDELRLRVAQQMGLTEYLEYTNAFLYDIPSKGYVRAVAVGTLDGRLVAVFGGDECDLWILDLADMSRISEPITGHTDWIYAVAIGGVGHRSVILSGGKDRVLMVRNPDGTLRDRIDLDAEIYSIAQSSDSSFVIATHRGLLALDLL